MKLEGNKKVFFDPVSHTYLLGEKELIGVTSLLKKFGLSADYSGIPQKVLDAAAAKGTSLHEQIEAFDNGEAILLSHLIQQYKKLCQENRLKFVCNELLVTDEEAVASMIDGVYEGTKPNTVILIDYKSTLKLHWRSLSWQLSVYKYLFERQYPGIKVESLMVLHIDKKTERILGLFPVEEVPESEVEALLTAEKEGRIYIDENEEPTAALVLTDQELDAYISGQSEISALKKKLKDIEAAMKEMDNRVLDYMLEHNLDTLECDGGAFKVTKAYTRTTLDSERLKATYPGLFDMYKKVVQVSASVSFKEKK